MYIENGLCISNDDLLIFTSTMDSSKETHRYAFELIKASRTIPVDIAEWQPHIQKNKNQLSRCSVKD